MTRNWREYLSSGGYLALLLVALRINTRPAWLACLAATLAVSLVTWLINLRRLRAITDTPTARVASAAQGYVELVGSGRPLPDTEVLSPAHHLPCLWYRYRRYETRNDKWVETDAGESDAAFYLDDGSGRCLLNPADAEILSDRTETFREGDIRIEEELLLAGDRLYALGDFVSLDGGHARLDERAALNDLLDDWKADQDDLRRRFDLDKDGRIDEREWALARLAARREVARQGHEADNQPVSHVLRRPADGRPCLIASQPPDELADRYRWRTRLHAAVLIASLGGVAGLMSLS